MLRRAISFIVVVGMFASQMAAIPHAHGGMSPEEQQKHDATPHLHFGHGKHCHSHSHAHGHCHCHHPPKSEQKSDPKPAGDGLNHDQDAVFLGKAGKLTITVSGSPVVATTVTDLPSCVLPAIHGFEGASVPALPWHPPDKVADDSDAYLILRTLRI